MTTASNGGQLPRPITPLVASLREILKGKLGDPKEAWRQHLEEKYRGSPGPSQRFIGDVGKLDF